MERTLVRIADIVIALESEDPGLVRLEGAWQAFRVGSGEPEVTLRVARTARLDEPEATRTFEAGAVWQLHESSHGLAFSFASPASGPGPYEIARFDRALSRGDVLLDPRFPADASPLSYPLDEVLILHLLARGRGAEIHGCGLVDQVGRGILFAGQSGAGKTTTARLWAQARAASILSDERVVVRLVEGSPFVHGTPWHGEGRFAEPSSAPLRAVFFLRHGRTPETRPLSRASAVARLVSCSFLPFHDPAGLAFTLGLFDAIAARIPCMELAFVPGPEAVAFVRSEMDGHGSE